MAITENKKSIIIENDFARITLSKKNSLVESIIDKSTGKDIKATEKTRFFDFVSESGSSCRDNTLTLDGDTVNVGCTDGETKVKVGIEKDYFTFEILSHLPENTYRFIFAHCKYNYDLNDINGISAIDIAMTINANPHYFPSGNDRETLGSCNANLPVIGAKLGVIIAPEKLLCEIAKKLCDSIDRSRGLTLHTCGPWSEEYAPNHKNYLISLNTSLEYNKNNLEFYKELGVDQIDFHQGCHGVYTFRQGDFKFVAQKDGNEFKNTTLKLLRKNGMEAGIHTYSHYLDPDCPLLADEKYINDLETNEVFTLAGDIDEKATKLRTVESTKDLPDLYGFFQRTIPYIRVGNEIMSYIKSDNGFVSLARGSCNTKAEKHKKGDKIYHFNGFFNLFCANPGSELFLEVARNTAKAYNEGGFSMIYIDAIDGMHQHCKKDEVWYYDALFVLEILKNCKTEPIIEYSDNPPSLWAVRGRMNAYDCPGRGYKNFNNFHSSENQRYKKAMYTATLGWYEYFPLDNSEPANFHTRHMFRDDIDHMGTLAIAEDYSTVFRGNKDAYFRYNGERENIKHYNEYETLRKAHYFNKSVCEKLKKSKYEGALKRLEDGKFGIAEKYYDKHKMFDIANCGDITVSNPFKMQTPYFRIETSVSTQKTGKMLLLPLNEEKELTEQKLSLEFGSLINIINKRAITVKVKGNGKKGSAICIKLRPRVESGGNGSFIIDTDFKGWREFVLTQTDNGERPDMPFDSAEGHFYNTYNKLIDYKAIRSIEVVTAGDTNGVRMSGIYAYDHVYDVIKNPTVKCGDKSIMFECELLSTDILEYSDGKAEVIDRYGNRKPVWFDGSIELNKGKNKVTVSGKSLNGCPVNLKAVFGFEGKIIK